VLILGLFHPPSDPRLDWWELGDTLGNRYLRRTSQALKRWLLKEHGLNAVPLPYHVENGGLFLKDAAVLAGLGIVGRNNLVVHPQWGPRVRWRSLLIREALAPTSALQGFAPCDTCDGFCHKACPAAAFAQGGYHRPPCLRQMNKDEAQPGQMSEPDFHGRRHAVIKYCRACELACPVGARNL
jgi:epoxyqueuosine reductase